MGSWTFSSFFWSCLFWNTTFFVFAAQIWKPKFWRCLLLKIEIQGSHPSSSEHTFPAIPSLFPGISSWMPLSISYHLPISSASSCTFLWNEIQIAIKINLWSCICICLKGLNRLSQRNEALIVGNIKQSQDFKLWPRKTDKANKPDWIVGKMKGNGMYPRRHGFSLKKIKIAFQNRKQQEKDCSVFRCFLDIYVSSFGHNTAL